MKLKKNQKRTIVTAAAITALTSHSLVTNAQIANSETNAPAQLPEVVVQGKREQPYVPTEAASGKLQLPIRDTVQTVSVVPREVLVDRGVTTVNKAIETAPGVQPIVGYGGMDSAAIISRGFANDWLLRDGFRLFRYGLPLDPAIAERVEVLKGPTSLLAGQTDPGGTLNIISKQPIRERFLEYQTTFGSYNFFRNTLDLGGAIPGSDDRLLTRLTLAHESSESHRDFIDQNKILVAPQIGYQITPETFVRVEFEYYRNEFDFERGLPADPRSFDVPKSRVLTHPSLPRSLAENKGVFESVTHQFGDSGWKLRQGLGLMFNDQNINEMYPNSVAPNGDVSMFYSRSEEKNQNLTAQLELQGDWEIASRPQKSMIGIEYSNYLFDYDFFTDENFSSPTLNLFNPNYNYPLPPRDTPAFGAEYGSDAYSLYFDHQAEIVERVKLLGGGRFDWAYGFSRNHPSGADAYPTKLDFQFSPRVGVVYTPVDPADVFFSYSTSFKPNVFGTDPSGKAYDPETGEQFEAGLRYEFIPKRLRAQAAIYQITKDNVVVYQPPTFESSTSGSRRSEGVELELQGSPIAGWNVTGGYALSRSEIKSDTDPAKIGSRLLGVPRHQFSLWNVYEFQEGALKGFALGYGLFYAGHRAANEPETVTLPSYLRHDLMARYRFKRMTAQVNIENLTSEDIYDAQQGGFIAPRAPITLRASLTFAF